MSKLERLIRCIYIIVAFASALALHIGVADGAFAAEQQTQPRQFDMESYLADRIDHVEAHQTDEDSRTRELSDKVTTMEGIGEGSFTVLAVLNLLGFLAKLKKDGDS